MSARSVIVGTAGHIDHGKTLLVRALTGVDTDRLPEEKRRGITIDLGFASCEAPAPDGSTLDLSFVDVPGHKLFVRNMLAGAGGIDCVLLVIAADDGVMPQTEEHLAICTLLGIERGLTVLTKTDLVSPERLGEARAEVAAFLRGSFLVNAPVLAVSAATGQGIPELRDALAKLAASTPQRSAGGLLRLPLDRAFSIKGFGTVVTGTLQSGTLTRGQALLLEPGGVSVRARGLQIHNRAVEQATAGSRVAINLAGVEVADAPRGATLVGSAALGAVDTLDAELGLLPDAPELKHRARVRFHCFTSEVMASVSLYGAKTVLPGGRALVRFRLAQPVVLVPGDRFVLRQPSPARTVGGGRVLDAHPLPAARKKDVHPWLVMLANADAPEQVLLRVSRRGTAGVDLGTLSAETGWTEDALRAVVAPFVAADSLRALESDLLLAREHLAAAARLVTARWKPLAAKLPTGAAGVKRAELQAQSRLQTPVFDAALAHLVESRTLAVEGQRGAELVLPFGATAQMPPADRQRLDAITTAYRQAGLAAPLTAEVARTLRIPDPEMKRLVTILLRANVLHRLGADDLLMHGDALQQLESRIRALRGQLLDVGRFKQITGLSRKHAIPLLEYLDRRQVTRKQGESRLIL